ncbi:MAG TPA: metal-sensitive transcriptional regulator [Bacillota bacterium]|nr:metal-sensitive transcriptional regulator [Bacillota bacterium]
MSGDTEDLLRRMRKIEGQARGVQRMLTEGRGCEEITHQLAAMRSALARVAAAIIAAHLDECLSSGQREDILAQVADMLARV